MYSTEYCLQSTARGKHIAEFFWVFAEEVGKVVDSSSDGLFCHLTSLVQNYSSVVLRPAWQSNLF